MIQPFNFVPPLDVLYSPSRVTCLGRNIFNAVVVWVLDISTGEIILTSDVGAEYNIGRLTKPTRRCSLAFVNSGVPNIIIEYSDGEVVLFEYNLVHGDLKSTPTKFTGYRDVSICYNRSLSKNGLVVAAIGVDGVYRGTITQGVLIMKNVNPLSDATKLAIHRFGLSTENKLIIELASLI